MTIPSLVSLKDELDMGLGFAAFALSFLLSGEEERLTERVKKLEKVVPVNENLDGNTASEKVETGYRKGGVMVEYRTNMQPAVMPTDYRNSSHLGFKQQCNLLSLTGGKLVLSQNRMDFKSHLATSSRVRVG